MSPDGGPRPDDGPLAQDVARLLLILGRLVRSLRRSAAPSDLAAGALSALALVVREGAMRPGDLAAREGVTAPTMSRVVDGLVRGGWVLREVDPDDRRAQRITATTAGRDLIHGLRDARVETLLARVRALPAADRSALLAAVPALEQLADDGWAPAPVPGSSDP